MEWLEIRVPSQQIVGEVKVRERVQFLYTYRMDQGQGSIVQCRTLQFAVLVKYSYNMHYGGVHTCNFLEKN